MSAEKVSPLECLMLKCPECDHDLVSVKTGKRWKLWCAYCERLLLYEQLGLKSPVFVKEKQETLGFKIGDRVRLKKTKEMRTMFPKLQGKKATVMGTKMLPEAFRVKFDCHQDANTWSPEYFVKVN